MTWLQKISISFITFTIKIMICNINKYVDSNPIIANITLINKQIYIL